MTATTSTPAPDAQDGRAIAEEYFKRVDGGGDVLALFADNAYLWFPKHTLARGVEEIKELFGDVSVLVKSVIHDIPYFNYIVQGDRVVVEGTTSGVTADGTEWRAGETLAGRFCNVFEIRDGKIHRLFIYLDPDYGDADTARYPWLNR